MYDGAVTCDHSWGETSEFPIVLGLHQGPLLSPYLFPLVINEFNRMFPDVCYLEKDTILVKQELE